MGQLEVAPGRLLSAGWLTQAILAGLPAPPLPPLGALLVAVFVLALLDTPLSAAGRPVHPAVVADDDLVAANTVRVALPGIEVVRLHSLSTGCRTARTRWVWPAGFVVRRRRFRSRVGRALRGSGPG